MLQTDRPLEVIFNGETDRFLLRRMSGTEQLGRLFEYKLELLSEDPDISLAEVLGKPMVVRMTLPSGDPRFFHAHVSRFSFAGMHGSYAAYQATLRPWLWFLTRRSNCRVFESESIPDIVKKICQDDHGFSDIEERYNQTQYNPLEFCVQYRETDFNFVSRLLEQAGIYYYFKHEEAKHTLVLSNAYGSHDTVAGYETVPYFPPVSQGRRERDHISGWFVTKEIQPGAYALNDWDFERAGAGIDVNHSLVREHEKADYEFFDYPGEYVQSRDQEGDTAPDDADGVAYAESRLLELQSQHEKARGSGDVAGFGAGVIFTLEKFPREDQNREYLVESIVHELDSNEFDPGGSGGRTTYGCSFAVVEAQQTYRTPRTTPKPVVQGPQTATVVGDDAIWTDKYGRIKVKFHWDRESKASCWVRVAQASAGANWGSMFIPQVDHEVVVEFLEGDPDRPIVTGSVYNSNNLPPLPLTDHKDKSIIRDCYGNEIIFDHTPGNEHLRLRSPHHQSSLALGQSLKFKTASDRGVFTIGDSDEVCVGNSKKLSVGHDTSYTFGSKFSVFGGWEVGIWAGASFNVNVGAKAGVDLGGTVSAFIGYKYSFTKGKEISAGGNDYVQRNSSDILFDSQKSVFLASGADRNSIVEASPNRLLISFGKDSNAKDISDGASAGQMLATEALAAYGMYKAAESSKKAGAKAAAQQAKDFSPATGHPTAEEQEVLDEVGGQDQGQLTMDMIDSASQSGVALVGAIASAAAMLKKEDVPNPNHDDKKARMFMSSEGLQIETLDGSSELGRITIYKDGAIAINNKKSSKKIEIISAGEITIKSDKPVKVLSKEVIINKGSVKMKNFEDKG